MFSFRNFQRFIVLLAALLLSSLFLHWSRPLRALTDSTDSKEWRVPLETSTFRLKHKWLWSLNWRDGRSGIGRKCAN
jgi:hypothetical protein